MGDDMRSLFVGKITSVMTACAICLCSSVMCSAEVPEKEHSECFVLAEVSTGTVIKSSGGDKRVRMGSFNKLMTVLLAAEAMDRGELASDTVLTTSENANSKQGAQIWLMPGEKMQLSDLLKGVIIGNANDAACVIAERIGGTEEKFTQLMNERAAELGMKDTLFTECTGYYDDENQYTTAADAAKLLCELCRHDELTETFTTRLDELKNGEVQLVTTNTMCSKYKGSVGFKCGTGPSSGYFAAEAAVRNGVAFAAAVFDCEDEDMAMAKARELLDLGFGGYTVTSPQVPEDMPSVLAVKQGSSAQVGLSVEPAGNVVVPINRERDIRTEIYLPSYVYAPLEKGEAVGEIRYFLGDKMLRSCRVCSAETVEEKNTKNVLFEMMKYLVSF